MKINLQLILHFRFRNTQNVRENKSRVILPQYPGFRQIVVLTKGSSQYGELSPYHLRNEQGQLLENIWQFSKIYPKVPRMSIPYSSRNSKIVWKWPGEVHIDSERILEMENDR